MDASILPAGELNPSVPRSLLSNLLWLPDRSRNMGIHIMAGKGSGKSRLMGRGIAWLDFLRGIPVVIFDPHGPTIDNFLDKITRLSKEVQELLWRRVSYIDMSGCSGYVVPFPLYYRLGREGLYEISQRYLDVLRKLDPHLQTASIEGWNPLWRIGTCTGMILAALGFQITEAESLIGNPTAWRSQFARAQKIHPEIEAAVEFFEDFMGWKEETQSRRSDSFLNKIGLFAFDGSMRAMFGASTPGVDWSRVVNDRLAVLLDFRGEHDVERRRFKMVWAFNYFLNFIKHRGAGRHRPISLIIDELTSLFSAQTLATDLFASDLDELINVIARNYMVWLTIGHQELFQLDERARKALMAMGTQIMGVTSDRDTALSLAYQFFRFDPYQVKKREPVYSTSFGVSHIIDHRTVEFTLEEQMLLKSYTISDQGRFRFLVRPALGEGDVTGALQPVTLVNFDRELYPNGQLVARARQILMEKRGRRVNDVLVEMESRSTAENQVQSLPQPEAEKNLVGGKGPEAFATIVNNEQPDDLDDPSEFGEKKTASQSKTSRAG